MTHWFQRISYFGSGPLHTPQHKSTQRSARSVKTANMQNLELHATLSDTSARLGARGCKVVRSCGSARVDHLVHVEHKVVGELEVGELLVKLQRERECVCV